MLRIDHCVFTRSQNLSALTVIGLAIKAAGAGAAAVAHHGMWKWSAGSTSRGLQNVFHTSWRCDFVSKALRGYNKQRAVRRGAFVSDK